MSSSRLSRHSQLRENALQCGARKKQYVFIAFMFKVLAYLSYYSMISDPLSTMATILDEQYMPLQVKSP
jgi:hypothetical protein